MEGSSRGVIYCRDIIRQGLGTTTTVWQDIGPRFESETTECEVEVVVTCPWLSVTGYFVYLFWYL
jgi:hypothetical protein